MIFKNYGEAVKEILAEMNKFDSEIQEYDESNHEEVLKVWEKAHDVAKRLWAALKADPVWDGILTNELLQFMAIIVSMQEQAKKSNYHWEDFLKVTFGE